MPKQTFFNLPESKRQTLIQAAQKEFSRVPVYQASISNIVKSAEIARGSFYQYFEDKEDIFFFILEERTKEIQTNFMLSLKKYDGDIFDAITEMFQLLIKGLPNQEKGKFYKNAFLHMTHKIESSFSMIFSNNEEENNLEEISKLINRECLNITNDRELYHMMQILTTVMFRNLVERFAKELTQEEVIASYTIEMKLLKEGLYKRV
ncbi:AcrR family transcriptional regulator [Virgibacillus halotolerans]|uniref:TetR/AcrR family transcriptional regulator n=1 Tax=Virgibacillus halotolerans TaxID=1071053 RepID=UPI0019613DC3|nr:TetR family transcriptional regulator [Virgibacillus halotolerans]MBM7600906.1 AcrR family transcriptional regulator [Virgibacillus halotolerans]